jgi:hypothetical protein
MAREQKRALKQPVASVMLVIIGVFQFVGASFYVLILTTALAPYLQPGVLVLGLIVGISLGLSASVTSFAFARVVADLYATRWHTDSYEVERDDDERRMMDGMARNLAAIARAVAPDQAVALEAADDAQEVSDDNTDQDEAAPVEVAAPSKKHLSLNDWLWVVAAFLIMLCLSMLYAILTR